MGEINKSLEELAAEKQAEKEEARRKMYEAADKLNEAEPWKYFCEVDICEIYLKDSEEPYYCEINGMFDEQHNSVSFYKGQDGLVSLSSYINMAGCPEHISMSRKNCIECEWEPKAKERPLDIADLKLAGKNYGSAASDEWPKLRFYQTGYEPHRLTVDQMKEFAAVAEQLSCAVFEMKESGALDHIREGERIRRMFDSEKGEWINELLPAIDKIEAVTDGCLITDELLVRRLKKRNMNGRYLEMDIPYIPFRFRENRVGDRYKYPQLCMICDAERAAVEGQHILQGADDIRDVALGMLVNYIETKGRPQTIYVRSAELFGIIGDLCAKSAIPLVFSPLLKILDFFVEDIIEHFSNNIYIK